MVWAPNHPSFNSCSKRNSLHLANYRSIRPMEIKNPLNLCNNFSDTKQGTGSIGFCRNWEKFGKLQLPKAETFAIPPQDVQSRPGQSSWAWKLRADSIVTSMLNHSRASGSKREPKHFQFPLVKEFVNLSFHGMRAGKSPIQRGYPTCSLTQKLGERMADLRGFSRVILNLL